MTAIFHQNINSVVPWQATYSFPSQATQSRKQTVKLIPTTGTSYNPDTGSRRIIFNLPSDGYWNAMNSAFSANLTMTETLVEGFVKFSSGTFIWCNAAGTAATLTEDEFGTTAMLSVKFKGTLINMVTTGVSTGGVFSGPLPLAVPGEATVYPATIYTYGTRLQRGGGHELIKRVRIMYGGVPLEDIDEYGRLARHLVDCSVGEGYAASSGAILDGTGANTLRESRGALKALVGVQTSELSLPYADSGVITAEQTSLLRSSDLKRNVIFNPFTGLTRSQKLIPLKWMAAQFTIELELAPAAECLLSASAGATYSLADVCWIAEIHEFDSLYDASFYDGMVQMGIPIKFTSYKHQQKSISGSAGDYQIQERARSLKHAIALIQDSNVASTLHDTHISYHNTGNKYSAGVFTVGTAAPVEEFQWRVGGRYMPAQRVNCQHGAAEAYLELMKVMNTLGDFSFHSNMHPTDWSSDFGTSVHDGEKFAIAMEFENTDVFPNTIAGLNAENQSDINLFIKCKADPSSKTLHIFTAFDNLLIIKDGHLVDLVM